MTRLPPPAWDRIEELFARAVALEPDGRTRLLDAHCPDEPGVRLEVESLLAAHDSAGTFLEMAGVEALAPALVRGSGSGDGPPRGGFPDANAEGLRFGPYRVVRELGHGGMGTVYLAVRADESYQREVAIKLVRWGPAAGLARRLGRERRILASLEHPSIARLYDAGSTAQGQPYLVMEYVEGRRIDVYCDEADVTLEDRLRLFDRVCAAVEFAHGKLVVHRDLKPGNILVTGGGVPKLLDFGVARLLEPHPDDPGAEPTTTGVRAMTPEYASPEQLRGDPASISSDVWALGVLLYRLLTGRHPFRFESRAPLVVERTLRAQTLLRPSEAVLEGAEGGSTARARRLRGDLDTIVLAALHLDPARRYGTVAELRADIRAHLAGFPVSARADTWGYRAGKFLRRNRTGTIAASVVALAVLGGATGIASKGRVAAREAARAEVTRDYLLGMFATLDPDALQGSSLTVEELLDLGAAGLDAELASEPDVRAELAGVLGDLYQRLGAFEKARPLLETAREDLVRRRGEDDAASASATGRLAALLETLGEYDEAEGLARAALASRRRLFGPADTLVARSLASLGAIRNARGDQREAKVLHQEALEIDRRHGTPEAVAGDLSNLGLVHAALGEFDDARRLLEEAVAIRRELYGDRDTRVALALHNLASVSIEAGAFDDAIRMLEQALSVRREILGDDHPDVAATLSEIGLAHQARGDLEAAEAALLQSLEIRRRAFGADHPEVANSLNNLGVVSYFRAEFATAADHFEAVAEIWRDQLGDEHPNVLSVLNNLGAARREAGELDAAEVVLREVLRLRQETLPEGHPDIPQSHNNLASVLSARGRYAEAEEYHRTAIDLWREALGHDHPTVAFGLYGLGKLLQGTGRCIEAEPVLREAVEIREAALDPESTDLAVARYYLGLCRLEAGDPSESEALLRRALPPMEARWGPDHELTVGGRAALRKAAAARDGTGEAAR